MFLDSLIKSKTADIGGSSLTFPYSITADKAGPALSIVLAAFALTVLEGALRKWVIGSASPIESYVAYFSKDVVFAVLVFLPVRGLSSAALDDFRRWLNVGCLLLVFGAAFGATHEVNFAGAVLTLRALVFLPVIACIAIPRLYGLPLRTVVGLIGLLAFLNFSLGVVQNQLPPDHVLNRYANDTLDITTSATGVRATGTFSYISGMGVFSTVAIWGGMVSLSLAATVRDRILGWAILASGFGCGLASISRGPVLTGFIMVLPWVLIHGNRILKRVQSIIACTILVALALYFTIDTTFVDLGQGLLLRAETSNDSAQARSLQQFEEVFVAIDMAPLGMGLGTEQVGGNLIKFGQMSFTTFETQLPRLVLEVGVVGLLGFLVMCAGAILALQLVKRSTEIEGERAALMATQLLLLSMFASNVVFNHVASAFVWIIFATVMASCTAKPPFQKADAELALRD